MEEKQGRRVNVGGILRFLLGVLIVIVVAYLLVRFINSRRANNDAEQATQQTSQNEDADKSNDSSSSNSGSAASDSSQSDTSNDNSETEIPSGFADSDSSNKTESDSSQSVPAAGMGDGVIYIALVSGFITFGAYELANLRKKSTDK